MSGAPPAKTIRRLDLDRPSEATATDVALATANLLNGAAKLTVAFDASPQDRLIAHGLGRRPRGWIVSRVFTAPWDAFEVSSDDLYLTIRNVGAAAYSGEILVF